METMQLKNLHKIGYICWSAVLCMGMLPFIYLVFFNHPLGTHEWDWISNWAGSIDHLNYWEEQVYWYQANTGRYTSTALLSLTNFWYTLPRFQLLFLLNLLVLAGAIFLFLNAHLSRQLSLQKKLLISGSVFFLYIDQLTNTYESLFRFTVVIIYQLGTVFSLLLFALVQGAKPYSRRRTVVGLLVAFLLAGTNEISVIVAHLFMVGSFLYWRLLRQHVLPQGWYFIYLGLVVGTILLLSAPGNGVRMGYYPNAGNLLVTISLTIAATLYLWVDWLTNSLLIPISMLLVPHLVRYLSIDRKALWLLLAGMILLVPVCMAPFFWASGGIGFPERIIDLLFLFFSLCFGGICIHFFQRIENRLFLDHSYFVILISVFSVGTLFFGGLSLDRSGVGSGKTPFDRLQVEAPVGNAWLSILRDEPARYDKALQNQYLQVRNCRSDTCWVEPPPVFPIPLYDQVYDRKLEPDGDVFMGPALGRSETVVRYSIER